MIAAFPYRAAATAVLCIVALSRIPSLAHIPIDNQLARWVDQQGPGADQYREFLSLFGGNHVVLVLLQGKHLFNESMLDTTADLASDLESFDGVLRVEGVPVLYRDEFGREDASGFRQDIATTPYYHGFMVSRDLTEMTLFVEVDPEAPIGSVRELTSAIQHRLNSRDLHDVSTALIGPTVLNTALDRISRREAMRLFPLSVAISAMVLLVYLRSLGPVLAAMCSAGLALLLLLTIISTFGFTLNIMTMSLMPMIWVLSLSGSLHLIIRTNQNLRIEIPPIDALKHAVADTLFPNTLAALTTGCGFLSLTVSPMNPVRELGLFGGVGMGCIALTQFVATPVILGWMTWKTSGRRIPVSLSRKKSHPRSWRPAGIALVLLAVSVPGIFAIRTNASPLTMFAEESPLREDYRALSGELVGAYTLDTVIHLPAHWTVEEVWPVLDELQAALEGEKMAVRTVGPTDTLRLLNQWHVGEGVAGYTLPDSRGEAIRLLDSLEDSDRRRLRPFVSDAGHTVRFMTFVVDMDPNRLLQYTGRIDRALEQLPHGYSGYTTGMVLRIVREQERLLDTQKRSFGVALATIFGCIGIALRSFRLCILSIIPNALPIATVFGIMGYLQIPLDTGTVMVASLALGIATDDTVHVLVAISRAPTTNFRDAISSLEAVRHAMAITTAALSVGFLVMVFSDFTPLVRFGLLATIALVLAYWADVYVLPALINFGSGKGANRG